MAKETIWDKRRYRGQTDSEVMRDAATALA